MVCVVGIEPTTPTVAVQTQGLVLNISRSPAGRRPRKTRGFMRQVAVVLAAFVCGALFALSIHSSIANTRSAPTTPDSQLVPPCPHVSYGADGNMGPLFCVVDNPLALRYFASIGRHTFALGPDASPGEVAQGLSADYKHGGTGPIMCSIYQLAAWRNHWHFGVTVYSEVSPYCKEPSFGDAQ